MEYVLNTRYMNNMMEYDLLSSIREIWDYDYGFEHFNIQCVGGENGKIVLAVVPIESAIEISGCEFYPQDLLGKDGEEVISEIEKGYYGDDIDVNEVKNIKEDLEDEKFSADEAADKLLKSFGFRRRK